MCHHRDTCLRDRLDTVGIFHTTLKFHGLTVGLLHDASCITDGILHRCLIRHKGHVDDHESLFGSTAYSLSMMNHVVNGDCECVFVTQHDIAKRIAHEYHVNTCLVDRTGSVKVISRKHAHRA